MAWSRRPDDIDRGIDRWERDRGGWLWSVSWIFLGMVLGAAFWYVAFLVGRAVFS